MRSVARRGQEAPPTRLKGAVYSRDESQLEASTRSFFKDHHFFVASREERTLRKEFAMSS